VATANNTATTPKESYSCPIPQDPKGNLTLGIPLNLDFTHIKRPPNSRCVFLSGLGDTAKMTAHSKATGLPDLADDRPSWVDWWGWFIDTHIYKQRHDEQNVHQKQVTPTSHAHMPDPSYVAVVPKTSSQGQLARSQQCYSTCQPLVELFRRQRTYLLAPAANR
jgi:hypothetical protein